MGSFLWFNQHIDYSPWNHSALVTYPEDKGTVEVYGALIESRSGVWIWIHWKFQTSQQKGDNYDEKRQQSTLRCLARGALTMPTGKNCIGQRKSLAFFARSPYFVSAFSLAFDEAPQPLWALWSVLTGRTGVIPHFRSAPAPSLLITMMFGWAKAGKFQS